ncbi:MAG: hypothetical protein U1E56_12935 [Bauldia sp.]|mgnify:CR=1 FL=1
MGKILNGILIAAMIGSAAFTYNAKHRAEVAARRLVELREKVAKEQTALSLAKAEWSVLVQPARLEALALANKAVLGLAPTEAGQLGTIEDIPLKAGSVGPAPQGAPGSAKSIAGVIAGRQ